MRSTKLVLIEPSKGRFGAGCGTVTEAPLLTEHGVPRVPGVCPSGQRAGAVLFWAKAARFFKAVWTKASNRIPAAPMAAMPFTS
jgi:hypothetical protein